MTDYLLSRDFRASEFDCQHCGKRGIQQKFVENLQGLRDALGVPLIITSGYRCEKHPIEANKPKGPGIHTLGLAADIRAVGVSPRDIYFLVLKEFPCFTGIGAGAYRNTLHLDSRPLIAAGKRAVTWAYDAAGNQVKWAGIWAELPK